MSDPGDTGDGKVEVVDATRKFVRVLGHRGQGPGRFVEFSFAIADPELAVELILPEAAFAQFCRDNEVTLLEGEAPRHEGEMDWAIHDAARGIKHRSDE